MKVSVRSLRCASAVLGALLLVSTGSAVALQVKQTKGRFDSLVVEDPTTSLDVATTPVAALAAGDRLRKAWDGFLGAHGSEWAIHLDRRSGAPLLVEGRGIPWPAAAAATSVESLEAGLRSFMAAQRTILLADDAELVLDREASARMSPDVWQVVFARTVAGVPVEGERYIFTIGYGNLIAFGTPRWSRIDASPFPDLGPDDARELLSAYMDLTAADSVSVLGKPELKFIPLRAESPQAGAAAGPYTGAPGAGYASALVWRIALTVAGEPGTWVALVDAHTGAVRSFADENLYALVKGGVYPISDDRICPDGCEQPNYPMPFADVSGAGSPQTANTMGVFNCTPGGSAATTTLAGPYVRVADQCGAISQSVSCDADLDLGVSGGIDCDVPAGASPGNTHSARTGFYHLNRIVEHARVWLPSRIWLTQQLTDNVNISDTCNAYWNGNSVNFFKSGGGCNNTGEIAGVFLHEWGHGLDQNDGGGYDNPSEAYADITAFMSTHMSCIGRGFRQSGNCSGYGDACLSCTGIRDMDYAKHASGTPATPSGFLTTNCPGGGGPCGRETHCEGHVGGETLWDLAVRDLPASGLDAATAWQLTDKLWYKSRNGSGGNAYNCSLPNSDGCSAGSWFSKLRAMDDDDGNLANGTPHAAAIYAAFNRHKIACGNASDASNQDRTSCAGLGAPSLTAVSGSASAQLTWSAVSGATGYKILRNDASCSAGYTVITTVPGTTFTDSGLADGFTAYYRVQPVTANSACDGPLSNCQSPTPQPYAGRIRLDASVYNCAATVYLTVVDNNTGASTVAVTVASTTEPLGETVTLLQSPADPAVYNATITMTAAAPASDGLLSLADGDTITASYVDADDGQGGTNVPRQATASADCALPVISKVEAVNVSWNQARVTWKTNEAATTELRYGTTPPPANTVTQAARVRDHAVDISGLSECTTYLYSAGSTDAVGNAATDTAGGAYYSFTTGKNSALDFPSADTPIAIPDFNGVGVTSTINVTQSKPVQDVNVTVNITHTAVGDLGLTLIAPNGVEIPLSWRRGGSGDNFSNTLFDDEAANSIASGFAPFTSSYRPESPLSVLDGINSAGAWRLRVEDDSPIDTGTLGSWKLTLNLPTPACGPRAAFQSTAVVADNCSAGGPGELNGVWDAGEQVQFKVTIANTGTVKLTGVSATITSTTPGVVLVDGLATFPAIGGGGFGDSQAPHFTVQLPTSIACGGTAQFNITINANEGSWAGSFSQSLGRTLGGTGTALSEAFTSGLPVSWSVVDGGTGGGAAATWSAADPGLRVFSSPLSSPVAMVDSDAAGSGATQDEELISAPLNLAGSPTVTLQFDQFFRWFAGSQSEIADVDVRSSATGGSWVNVLRQQGTSSANPDRKSLNISAQAGGASNVQVRFHYYGGSSEWYWEIDNVKIDTAAYVGCDMPVCGGTSTAVAKPVADGTFGTAMRGSRGNAAGTSISLTWDVGACASTDHHVVYGDLANVATATASGAFCDLGTAGSATWTGVPAGSLWFVVVGDDNATVEGTWGTDGVGGQRGGVTPSGFCGATARNNAASCP